jgi:hypothetical protein
VADYLGTYTGTLHPMGAGGPAKHPYQCGEGSLYPSIRGAFLSDERPSQGRVKPPPIAQKDAVIGVLLLKPHVWSE